MNRIKKLFPGLLIVSLICLNSCDKNDESQGADMTFQIFEGLESCGFLLGLELQDEWRLLEPINVKDFDIDPTNGLEVIVTFEDRPDAAITCEGAEPVELLTIEVK